MPESANCATQVLILDDEPIVCKRLKPAFQKAGYEVETFNDSASALARVEEKRFDVVITDLKMEGTDGLHFPRAGKGDFSRHRHNRHNRVCNLGDRQGII